MRRIVLTLTLALAIGITVGMIADQVISAQHMKVTPILKTTSTFTGEPVIFPREKNQITAVLFELAPGAESGRHRHPLTQFVYVLEGSVTIQPEGHQPKTFNAGEGFVETNAWHNGVNRGTVPVKALVVNIMEEGVPLRSSE